MREETRNEHIMKKYHGIIPPIITPIDDKENVDEEGFRKLIENCVGGGLHGIFVAGTNGECLALTQKERNNAIRIALSQVNGRLPVIAGVMDSSTRRVIENIKALEDMGGKCAAVTSIFYARHTSQSETVRHFERILRETAVDLFVYNIPPFTGLKLSPATVLAIAELDARIVGYKDSSGAYEEFMQVLAVHKDTPFSVLAGVTGQAISLLLMGADGFVPALGPAFPNMFADAYAAGKSGDLALAWKYNELVRESSKILGMTKNATAATKFAVSLLGFTHKRVIAPQDVATPEEEKNIAAKFREVNEAYAALKRS